ncbi:NAD(P)/FAD-dependent oxidoreductase [Rhodococcus koreensis]
MSTHDSAQPDQDHFDVIIVGGGIAGVSIGYELSKDRSVCLLEQESTLAYHTTGRSAALYLETFGNATIRALTTCSRSFLTQPPSCFENELLTPLQYMVFARPGRGDQLRAFHDEVQELAPSVRLVTPEQACELFPLLNRDSVEAALLDPDSMEIDVHALHQGYVRGMRENGAQIRSKRRVTGIAKGGAWTVTTADRETLTSTVIVNAAGAWADQVAEMAGVVPSGLTPMIRTVFGVGVPEGSSAKNVPVLSELDDAFYLKPEGDQFLCSPADETPSHPHDARQDELEIARAIDEINETTQVKARHVRSSWAGLRTFVADRSPVVGYNPEGDGFFWFAGQGGYGIQICDGLARTGASLVRGEGIPDDVAAKGVQLSDLAVDRPALRAVESAVTL